MSKAEESTRSSPVTRQGPGDKDGLDKLLDRVVGLRDALAVFDAQLARGPEAISWYTIVELVAAVV